MRLDRSRRKAARTSQRSSVSVFKKKNVARTRQPVRPSRLDPPSSRWSIPHPEKRASARGAERPSLMRRRTTAVGATLAVAASRRDAARNCKENRCRCARGRATSGASARTRSAGRCVTSARPTVLMVARAVFLGCSSVTIARRPIMSAPHKRDAAQVSRQRRTARSVSRGFVPCAEPIAANAVRCEPTTVATKALRGRPDRKHAHALSPAPAGDEAAPPR